MILALQLLRALSIGMSDPEVTCCVTSFCSGDQFGRVTRQREHKTFLASDLEDSSNHLFFGNVSAGRSAQRIIVVVVEGSDLGAGVIAIIGFDHERS